jgi:hypothetical protein
MSNNIVLELSTRVAPPKKFTVDGEEYSLLGVDHLSKEGETEAMALLARHSILMNQLAVTGNTDKGKLIAGRIRDCRLKVICKLTTLPAEVAGELPVSAQADLLETIIQEMDEGEDTKVPTGDESLPDVDL